MNDQEKQALVELLDKLEQGIIETRESVNNLMLSIATIGGIRLARCAYFAGEKGTHALVPSKKELAFFESMPDQDYDQYYCGCRGWD